MVGNTLNNLLTQLPSPSFKLPRSWLSLVQVSVFGPNNFAHKRGFDRPIWRQVSSSEPIKHSQSVLSPWAKWPPPMVIPAVGMKKGSKKKVRKIIKECLFTGPIIFRTHCKMNMQVPYVHKLRILRWKQPNTKPSVRPLWVWGPIWLHRSYAHETGLTYLLPFTSKGQKKSWVINLIKLACLWMNNIHLPKAHIVDFLLM